MSTSQAASAIAGHDADASPSRVLGKIRRTTTPAAHPAAVIRRYVVPQATIPGMAGPLDTTQIDPAKALIDQLFRSGRRASLATLYVEVRQHDPTNRTLATYVDQYLNGRTDAEAAHPESGLLEKARLKAGYAFADTSNPAVQAGLRMWVSGDPGLGLTWQVIGKHLRGQLTAVEYQHIGTMHYLREDQQHHTNHEPTIPPAQKEQQARQIIANAAGTIRGSLDALPSHDGVSYRQSGVASATTYGSTITIGDVIRDAAFWSTSALRISGSAGTWEADGTIARPKVFFIITGATGKYISHYAAQEEGQHEVLYKDRVCFRVDRIANYGNHTLFVNLTEVPPVPAGAAKNPYNGTPA